MKDPNRFYVYEHWRTDTDLCFYVGKGHGDRAYRMARRNPHHTRVVAKLQRIGHAVEVRIVASGLTEANAFALEIERIAFWREAKADLANLAAGGIGATGRKYTEAQRIALGERKKGNKNRLGAKLSDETKEKIAAGHRGKKLSLDHLRKMSEAVKGEKNPFHGKKHTAETGAKVAAANKARVWSKESREKLSATLKKIPHKPREKTWTHSEETKQRMRAAQQLRWAKNRDTETLDMFDAPFDD